MPDTTFGEATRCPKCKQPGKEVAQKRGPARSTVHVIECATDRCKWEGSRWLVQVDADGTIPDRSKMPPGPPKAPLARPSDEKLEAYRQRLREERRQSRQN